MSCSSMKTSCCNSHLLILFQVEHARLCQLLYALLASHSWCTLLHALALLG